MRSYKKNEKEKKKFDDQTDNWEMTKIYFLRNRPWLKTASLCLAAHQSAIHCSTELQ